MDYTTDSSTASNTTNNSNTAVRRKRKSASDLRFDVPRTCMNRLIRDILQHNKSDLRMTDSATEMLHTEAERHLEAFFACASAVAANSGRDTISANDCHVVNFIQQRG